VSKVKTSLRHHLDQITEAQLVTQVPANAKNDHLTIKVSPCKQLLHAAQLAHPLSSALRRPLYPVGIARFALEAL
jgi:hypothetical protein